jgi:outer membrane protein OmpA-like peptidoglycan-associated protein
VPAAPTPASNPPRPPTAAPAPPTQQAALPPAPAQQRRGESRVLFPANQSELPAAARGDLDTLARRLSDDETLRVQLNAYAADAGDAGSQSRRLSLSRALAVRSYLIDKGVRSTRLDVRALGMPQDSGPADRVDLVVVGR